MQVKQRFFGLGRQGLHVLKNNRAGRQVERRANVPSLPNGGTCEVLKHPRKVAFAASLGADQGKLAIGPAVRVRDRDIGVGIGL